MGKKLIRDFDVHILRLAHGHHNFEFVLSDDFFGLTPESPLQNGSGIVKVELAKSESMLQFIFNIDMTVRLTCDISLKEFDHQICCQHELIVKFGEEEKELSEEVIVIKKDATYLNLASFIYEYIILEVPMKKVHPDLDDEQRPDLVYQTGTEETESETIKEDRVDPRWEALKKLKN